MSNMTIQVKDTVTRHREELIYLLATLAFVVAVGLFAAAVLLP